jgi:calcineurin-like phosphoesterase family protein
VAEPDTFKPRDDIDPENTWVVSDTHFGHQNIVGFCHRPLDHEQAMIAEWRAHVPEDATVVHLGDLCYKGNAFFKNIVAPELTGSRKLLVRATTTRAATPSTATAASS